MSSFRCWMCLAAILFAEAAWAEEIRVGDRLLRISGRVEVKAEPSANSATVGLLDAKVHVVTVSDVSGGWLAIKGPPAGWIAADKTVSYAVVAKAFEIQQKAGKADSTANYYIGFVDWQFGKKEQALADLTEAIRLDPKFVLAYLVRGGMLADTNELDQALADFNQAVKLDPADASVYYLRANVWLRRREFDNALADLSEAIRLKPTASEWYSTRGAIWHEKGEFDKAILDFDQSLRLEPDNVGSWHGRGWAWQNKDELDKAIANYDRALQLDPEYSISYNNRGLAWHRKGQYDKALADLNEALRLDPKYVFAYENRGNARKRKGDYVGALDDYTKAMELDPQYFSPYNNRAWLRATAAKSEFRDGKQAVADATKACVATEWKLPNYVGTLAASYAEAGDFDKAVEWQTKAVELAKRSEKADYRMRLDLYCSRKPYREESP